MLFFKRDGRTGFTGIVIISVMQGLFIEVCILEISKLIFTEDQGVLYAKQFGYLGAAIGLLLMYINNKKYNGKYNQYRYYWKDEPKKKRILKGFCIIITLLIPVALVIVFGVHWKKN